ncbi:MAG: hypothetical protein ACERLM_10120 [Acidimicrobiales bacterium]
MTATAPASTTSEPTPRSLRMYERLLLLYPRSFRQEYSDDMVQVFGDLITHRADGRLGRVWPRVFGDLATSATRQRIAQLSGGAGGGRAGGWILVALIALAGLTLVMGSSADLLILFPVTVLLFLPALGLGLIWSATITWRTTGARPVARVLGGIACFVPAVVVPLASGDDWGWWIGVAIVLGLIIGLGCGAIWGLVTLFQSRTSETPARRSWAAVGLVVAAVVVLGSMAGAGFNSYLNSRPPPGDHSPGNASAQSRALWDAAHTGDLTVVIASIEACADPFVHFDDGGRARSNAEFKAGQEGGEPVDEPMLGTYLEIIDRLLVAEDEWSQRCNS